MRRAASAAAVAAAAHGPSRYLLQARCRALSAAAAAATAPTGHPPLRLPRPPPRLAAALPPALIAALPRSVIQGLLRRPHWHRSDAARDHRSGADVLATPRDGVILDLALRTTMRGAVTAAPAGDAAASSSDMLAAHLGYDPLASPATAAFLDGARQLFASLFLAAGDAEGGSARDLAAAVVHPHIVEALTTAGSAPRRAVSAGNASPASSADAGPAPSKADAPKQRILSAQVVDMWAVWDGRIVAGNAIEAPQHPHQSAARDLAVARELGHSIAIASPPTSLGWLSRLLHSYFHFHQLQPLATAVVQVTVAFRVGSGHRQPATVSATAPPAAPPAAAAASAEAAASGDGEGQGNATAAGDAADDATMDGETRAGRGPARRRTRLRATARGAPPSDLRGRRSAMDSAAAEAGGAASISATDAAHGAGTGILPQLSPRQVSSLPPSLLLAHGGHLATIKLAGPAALQHGLEPLVDTALPPAAVDGDAGDAGDEVVHTVTFEARLHSSPPPPLARLFPPLRYMLQSDVEAAQGWKVIDVNGAFSGLDLHGSRAPSPADAALWKVGEPVTFSPELVLPAMRAAATASAADRETATDSFHSQTATVAARVAQQLATTHAALVQLEAAMALPADDAGAAAAPPTGGNGSALIGPPPPWSTAQLDGLASLTLGDVLAGARHLVAATAALCREGAVPDVLTGAPPPWRGRWQLEAALEEAVLGGAAAPAAIKAAAAEETAAAALVRRVAAAGPAWLRAATAAGAGPVPATAAVCAGAALLDPLPDLAGVAAAVASLSPAFPALVPLSFQLQLSLRDRIVGQFGEVAGRLYMGEALYPVAVGAAIEALRATAAAMGGTGAPSERCRAGLAHLRESTLPALVSAASRIAGMSILAGSIDVAVPDALKGLVGARPKTPPPQAPADGVKGSSSSSGGGDGKGKHAGDSSSDDDDDDGDGGETLSVISASARKQLQRRLAAAATETAELARMWRADLAADASSPPAGGL